MSDEPISLASALASFDDLWSPRIVTRVNDYDVRIAKVEGEHLWHAHEHTEEFFLVIDGELTIALREPEAGERMVTLPKGSVFTVPRGVEHKPTAPNGASILLFEPTGTLTVGDRHEEVPDHVDATTGHALAVEDPEALREAAHLLRAPANARRLMESIAEAEGGSVERS